MVTTTITASARARLADYIRVHGPVPAVRVSAAQAQGRARNYRYWGAVRYEIRLSRRGKPTLVAQQRAHSDHRSRQLAEQDAIAIAVQEGRLYVGWAPGPLDEAACQLVLAKLADRTT